MNSKPLTPAIGTVFSGLNIPKINNNGLSLITDSLIKRKVIFIENQKIDIDQLIEFSSRFGELMELPYIKPMDEFPHVIQVLKKAEEINMGVFGGDWHSDFSFLDAPPRYSILLSDIIPEQGGDTLWVNMALAWKKLNKEFQDKLRDKFAVHVGAPYGAKHAPPEDEQFKGSIQMDRGNPEADKETLHPLVCKHPESGEEMLFINPTYTTRIDSVEKATSEAWLAKLYTHVLRPEFACRYQWSPGTIAIWDNRSTLHYAVNDYDGFDRSLYRVTIKGHRPLGVL